MWRWVVEQTAALMHQFRRLRIRSDKHADFREAFLSLGCARSSVGVGSTTGFS